MMRQHGLMGVGVPPVPVGMQKAAGIFSSKPKTEFRAKPILRICLRRCALPIAIGSCVGMGKHCPTRENGSRLP